LLAKFYLISVCRLKSSLPQSQRDASLVVSGPTRRQTESNREKHSFKGTI
jgi:hypothetical protein